MSDKRVNIVEIYFWYIQMGMHETLLYKGERNLVLSLFDRMENKFNEFFSK